MKVFVTGATGAIGRYVVPALRDAGHQVTGLARSEEKVAQLQAQGANVARVSLFDEGALKEVFAGHDAVANLATAIAPPQKAALPSAWAENERIRGEGSTKVVDAALAAGVGRLVQESITFTYPDHGDEWIDESMPLLPIPRNLRGIVTAEANAARFSESGGIGVLLRFALFYGPGSSHTDLSVRSARRHIGGVAGRPNAYQSSIHLADAASAVVHALQAPAGIYNVCDDEPVTKREYARAVGAAVGKRPWILLPGRLTRLAGKNASILTASQRVSNAKFKQASGWSPRYASVREGWTEVVDA
ncbi:MAG TPA: NAD(P)-dependent oxidoreductase [Acidimicrobiales bacterium]|jgi:nucleoside-diphosphate-sugar epimerase|nr:NAD(P)-dependent oxidoreductase [Acidimicrobiales bacterium]